MRVIRASRPLPVAARVGISLMLLGKASLSARGVAAWPIPFKNAAASRMRRMGRIPFILDAQLKRPRLGFPWKVQFSNSLCIYQKMAAAARPSQNRMHPVIHGDASTALRVPFR